MKNLISKIFFPILISCNFALPTKALARPYKCFGRVYQEPCHLVDKKNTLNVNRSYKAKVDLPNFHIDKQSFAKITKNTGHWRGYISGEGKVKLLLKIFSDEGNIASKFIGVLNLTTKDKPTLYSYITTIPKNKNWRWKIMALPILGG